MCEEKLKFIQLEKNQGVIANRKKVFDRLKKCLHVTTQHRKATDQKDEVVLFS